MSGLQTYVLRCDECGSMGYGGSPEKRLTEVRAMAAAAGWSHVLGTAISGPAPSFDFCPACSSRRRSFEELQ